MSPLAGFLTLIKILTTKAVMSKVFSKSPTEFNRDDVALYEAELSLDYKDVQVPSCVITFFFAF
eukprot:snap_masked-scaffold_12-processed-gene-4.32-mRNA-1 protein AED:1.00 eAED:1.00 QI:0/0/0/0/1/1/2/0/63